MKKKKRFKIGKLLSIRLKIKVLVFLLIFAICLVLIISTINSMLMLVTAIQKERAKENIGLLVPISITGTYDGKEGALKIEGDSLEINNIKAKGTKKEFTASNNIEGGFTNMELPKGKGARLDGHSYMPQFDQSFYNIKLDENSQQFKLNKILTTDSEGFRRHGNAYVVALGSYYGSKIGTKYKISFEKDGRSKTIIAILGDQKSDAHTDSNHQYHETDGSVVEFIMGSRSNANGEMIKQFGKVTNIQKEESGKAKLRGEINGLKIKITGTVDGSPVTASGSINLNGEIRARGIIGSSNQSENIENMVKWAIAHGEGVQKFGYSQAQRTCPYCHEGATYDYDCSSFVTAALSHGGGFPIFRENCKTNPFVTFNMTGALVNSGFVSMGDLPIEQCKRGDILLNPLTHVEICIGEGLIVGASSDKDGQSGESMDNEIYVKPPYKHFWTVVFRYQGEPS